MAAQRHLGPQAAVDLARFAGRYTGQGVRAFGLTGDEAAFPCEPFAEAFATARAAGLTAAPHAGDCPGPPACGPPWPSWARSGSPTACAPWRIPRS